jgi:hypothetical protein
MFMPEFGIVGGMGGIAGSGIAPPGFLMVAMRSTIVESVSSARDARVSYPCSTVIAAFYLSLLLFQRF